MSKIDTLIKDYSNYTFSSGGQTGSDYKKFEGQYQDILKSIAANLGAKLVNFSGNHYTFSTFMERDGRFAYISINDVRHFENEWVNNILVRTANHKTDYSGGMNGFTSLKKLEGKLDKTLR